MNDRETLIEGELKAALVARRERLATELREEQAASTAERLGGQYAGEVHDRGEESSADAQAEVNSAIVRHHQQELGLVDNALTRIDAGTYGACVSCGDDIDIARLQANPITARCRECQTAEERRG